jgi:hypothetical protein
LTQRFDVEVSFEVGVGDVVEEDISVDIILLQALSKDVSKRECLA